MAKRLICRSRSFTLHQRVIMCVCVYVRSSTICLVFSSRHATSMVYGYALTSCTVSNDTILNQIIVGKSHPLYVALLQRNTHIHTNEKKTLEKKTKLVLSRNNNRMYNENDAPLNLKTHQSRTLYFNYLYNVTCCYHQFHVCINYTN